MNNKLVVLIDNDAEGLSLLEGAILHVEPDCSCISFIFADQAIEVIGEHLKHTPDFIFVHVNVTRITGPECLTKLRKLSQLNDCRIIVFSGLMPAAVGEAFKQLGATDYYQKPIHVSEYAHTIQHIFCDQYYGET